MDEFWRALFTSNPIVAIVVIVCLCGTLVAWALTIGALGIGGQRVSEILTPWTTGKGQRLAADGERLKALGEKQKFLGMAVYQKALNDYNAVTLELVAANGVSLKVTVQGEEPAKLAAPGAAAMLMNTADIVRQITADTAARQAQLTAQGTGSPYLVVKPKQLTTKS